MNKSDLVNSLSINNIYLSKKDIEESINEILKFFTKELSKSNRIEIRGFGTFSTRKRTIRIARNPKTGTSVKVNSKSHPYFRASKYLRNNLKD